MTYQLYIGSNNETHKLELDKIQAILTKYHKGFTVQEAQGFWEGASEHTAVVTIEDDPNKVLATITKLKLALNQDAIGYQVASPMQFA